MPPRNTTEPQRIEDVTFENAIGERYLAYALSTIMSRSLPDVRDGLKPVHRRLLYAMLQLKLDPASGFKKCARVVGDVIGKYHPHGDTAVYDAMVRLAQSFAVRYPLVDGQGNFGSIDGDNAAAMRYTEARLTAVALALLQDIDANTVDFRPNYDGSEQEPVLLPAAFPHLLANGSEGIAVGMATSIPPHNADELCNALIYLIKHPNASFEKLVEMIPGPDFPTGGILVEPRSNILKSYETGRGSFRLRAKWEKENLSHGLYQLIVTEIPYQISKSRLIEKIADLFKEKKLSLLGNIRDESSDTIRIVLEPKSRQVDPEMLMESLFKLTELEVRISLNMNVLSASNVPQVMNLREVLQAFIDHRQVVLTRRSEHRLKVIEHRLEILKGLLIVYLNLDEVIRIIREEDEPKAIMVKRWKLSDVQVEAILNTRLRSLRKLEEMEIKKENAALTKEKKELLELLKDDTKRKQAITEEFKSIRKQFGSSTELGKRRTDFAEAPNVQVLSIEAFVEKEPITILCSKMGWIKALKGHSDDISTTKYKEGDAERFALKAHTTDRLLIFSSDGKCFTLGCDKLTGGKGFGEPVSLMVDMASDAEIVSLHLFTADEKILLASYAGKGFILKSDDALAQTRAGKALFNVSEGDRLKIAAPVNGDWVATIGENRKILVFPLSEVPEMKRGSGVWLQRFQQGGLSDLYTLDKKDGLSWSTGSKNFREDVMPYIGRRASTGRLAPRGFPRSNQFFPRD